MNLIESVAVRRHLRRYFARIEAAAKLPPRPTYMDVMLRGQEGVKTEPCMSPTHVSLDA